MDKKKNNILIVDDEPEIRGLMQEILKEEGYLTFAAKNAKEAQMCIDENPPDLVYLDIWMHDKDGVALLKEWSEADKLNFPVIMISGHATIETAVEATRLGAFDFIEKPLSIEKLVESAKKALSSSEKSREEDIALILKNNCNAYKDVFLTLDNKKDSDQIVFLNGEAGTEKEAFAQYIHSQNNNEKNSFATFQLDLLASDRYDNTEITKELKKIVDTIEKGTIFLSGYPNLILKNQIHSSLQKLPLGQGINFVVGLNLIKKKNWTIQNEELVTIISDGILLDLPPLRQCLQDIPGLLRGFIDYFVKTEDLAPRRFSLAAQNVLTKYAWPGNLKQLKNMVHATLLRPDKEIVNIEEIEETLTLQGPSGDLLVQRDILSMTMSEAKEQFEKAFLSRQLELVGGKVTELARRVGMERTNLYRKLSSLNIEYKNKQ